MTTADVVIVGGGVIGCSIAYHLRKHGVTTLVLEQGVVGSGASSAATGLLAPIRPFLKSDNPYMTLQLAGLRLFSTFAEELEDASGVSIEYERTGTLRVVDLSQKERLESWIESWRSSGFSIELLVGDELHRREPILAPGIAAGIYNADEPQINALQLVAAYKQAAVNAGVTFLTQMEVTGICRQGNRVTGLRTQSGDIACGNLVIAAGAWSAFCGDWLGVSIPVRPLCGQSLSLIPSSSLRHILFAEHIYMAPKMDGTIIVGATQEDTGFISSTTPEGIQSLLSAVEKATPILAKSTLKNAWAGLRPKTPDTRPVLGPIPGWENVVIASGHGGFGMLLSGITGQSIAEIIVFNRVPLIVQPFSLERFSPQFTSSTAFPHEPSLFTQFWLHTLNTDFSVQRGTFV